jgi:hypothetical protein
MGIKMSRGIMNKILEQKLTEFAQKELAKFGIESNSFQVEFGTVNDSTAIDILCMNNLTKKIIRISDVYVGDGPEYEILRWGSNYCEMVI